MPQDCAGNADFSDSHALCTCPQTTGEAVYTSDFGSDAAQLFASTVESTEPLAYIRAIDASPALEVCTAILQIQFDTPSRPACLHDINSHLDQGGRSSGIPACYHPSSLRLA